MIRKAKNTLKNHVRGNIKISQMISIIKKSENNLAAPDMKEARDYIEHFWVNLERYHPRDEDTLLGLSNPYLVPAHDPLSTFNFDEMYYWDSYFMVQGMLSDPSKKVLVMGILENLFTMLQRFKVIPNGSRTYLMGRSQPPLLTSFIFDVYESYNLDKRWLAKAIEHAKSEYEIVWMGTKKPHDRLVYSGLSRFYDINVLHDLAEAESGWDMTSRFNRRCLHYLPVDLNAFLYKYEQDFAKAAEILGKNGEVNKWRKSAQNRKSEMNKLMWSRLKNFYFDYNFITKKRSSVASLAGFMPLWAGMLNDSEAAQLVKNLGRFEVKGGLVTTDEPSIKNMLSQKTPTQWAHPNGWAPLHFLIVKGLEKYGYHGEARRIAIKWLKTNSDWFNTHGVFLEKYNVVQPAKEPLEGVYPSQTGFGWTNAIFERFCQDYIDE